MDTQWAVRSQFITTLRRLTQGGRAVSVADLARFAKVEPLGVPFEMPADGKVLFPLCERPTELLTGLWRAPLEQGTSAERGDPMSLARRRESTATADMLRRRSTISPVSRPSSAWRPLDADTMAGDHVMHSSVVAPPHGGLVSPSSAASTGTASNAAAAVVPPHHAVVLGQLASSEACHVLLVDLFWISFIRCVLFDSSGGNVVSHRRRPPMPLEMMRDIIEEVASRLGALTPATAIAAAAVARAGKREGGDISPTHRDSPCLVDPAAISPELLQGVIERLGGSLSDDCARAMLSTARRGGIRSRDDLAVSLASSTIQNFSQSELLRAADLLRVRASRMASRIMAVDLQFDAYHCTALAQHLARVIVDWFHVALRLPFLPHSAQGKTLSRNVDRLVHDLMGTTASSLLMVGDALGAIHDAGPKVALTPPASRRGGLLSEGGGGGGGSARRHHGARSLDDDFVSVSGRWQHLPASAAAAEGDATPAVKEMFADAIRRGPKGKSMPSASTTMAPSGDAATAATPMPSAPPQDIKRSPRQPASPPDLHPNEHHHPHQVATRRYEVLRETFRKKKVNVAAASAAVARTIPTAPLTPRMMTTTPRSASDIPLLLSARLANYRRSAAAAAQKEEGHVTQSKDNKETESEARATTHSHVQRHSIPHVQSFEELVVDFKRQEAAAAAHQHHSGGQRPGLGGLDEPGVPGGHVVASSSGGIGVSSSSLAMAQLARRARETAEAAMRRQEYHATVALHDIVATCEAFLQPVESALNMNASSASQMRSGASFRVGGGHAKSARPFSASSAQRQQQQQRSPPRGAVAEEGFTAAPSSKRVPQWANAMVDTVQGTQELLCQLDDVHKKLDVALAAPDAARHVSASNFAVARDSSVRCVRLRTALSRRLADLRAQSALDEWKRLSVS